MRIDLQINVISNNFTKGKVYKNGIKTLFCKDSWKKSCTIQHFFLSNKFLYNSHVSRNFWSLDTLDGSISANRHISDNGGLFTDLQMPCSY